MQLIAAQFHRPVRVARNIHDTALLSSNFLEIIPGGIVLEKIATANTSDDCRSSIGCYFKRQQAERPINQAAKQK
jgi:hypothetical protein